MGVIIQSGNDALSFPAEHISGDEDVRRLGMNQQAALLGSDRTEYYNATGLPYEGMVSLPTCRSWRGPLSRTTPSTMSTGKYFKHNNINQPNRNRLLWRDSSGMAS